MVKLDKKILFIDDSLHNRNEIFLFLQKKGFYIKHTSDPLKFATLITLFKPQILLINAKLLTDDHLNILENLNEEYHKIEVILISGDDTIKETRRAIDIGAAGFVSIPVKFYELIDEINKAFEKHLLQENIDQYKKTLEEELSAHKEKMSKALEIAEYQSRQIDYLLNSMSEPLIAVDMNSTIMLLNAAAEKKLNLKPTICIGMPFQKFIKAPNLNHSLTRILTTFKTSGKIIQLPPISAKIESRIFSVGINLIKNASDSPSGCLLVLSDQTEIHKAAQLRSGFLTLVAHEFRTPLSSLYNGLSILQDSNGEKESLMAAIEIINTSSKRLSGLVDNLVTFSNIQRPETKSDIHDVDIGYVIASCKERFCMIALAKEIRLAFNINPTISIIRTDGQLIKDALDCIIDNAIKFSPEKEDVVVDVDIANQQSTSLLCISVKDNGPGIPDKIKERMFEWFSQGEHYLTRKNCGIGIGLSLAQRAIELLDGTIEYNRSFQNGGSTFVIKVPVNFSEQQ